MADHDYPAHLYTDRATGRDALVHRDPHGAPLTAHTRTAPGDLPDDPPFATELTTAAALALLERTGEPYLFFTDPHTARGTLLYARYATGYGLISPL